jgi:hypothetical protein
MEPITKVVFVGAEKITFHRLTLEDLFTVSDDIVAQQEAEARKLAKDEKLARHELVNVVLEIRRRKPNHDEIIASTTTPQGASAVLRKSLTKAGVAADKQGDLIAKMNINQCLEVAGMLVLDIQDEPKSEDEKKEQEGQTESPLPVNPSTLEESLKAKAVGYGDPVPTTN